jgi:hypothetical protein
LALHPETKVVRAAHIVSARYEDDGTVQLTIQIDGDGQFTVRVHPETAGRLYPGRAISLTLAVP